jgi:hypothetical protein
MYPEIKSILEKNDLNELNSYLKRSNVDVNKDEILHLAIELKSNKLILEALVQNGADVNQCQYQSSGYLPLNIALHYHNMEAFNFLIENGANVHLSDDLIGTPLHKSVNLRDEVGWDAFSILVKLGASLFAEDHEGKTVFEKALDEGSIKSYHELFKNCANKKVVFFLNPSIHDYYTNSPRFAALIKLVEALHSEEKLPLNKIFNQNDIYSFKLMFQCFLDCHLTLDLDEKTFKYALESLEELGDKLGTNIINKANENILAYKSDNEKNAILVELYKRLPHKILQKEFYEQIDSQEVRNLAKKFSVGPFFDEPVIVEELKVNSLVNISFRKVCENLLQYTEKDIEAVMLCLNETHNITYKDYREAYINNNDNGYYHYKTDFINLALAYYKSYHQEYGENVELSGVD